MKVLDKSSLAVLLVCLGSCIIREAPPTSPESDDADEATASLRMLLRLTSGSPPQGGVFEVGIYDQVSGTQLYLGSSVPNGDFCTLNGLDALKRYRVEFYELPSRQCILWVGSVSLANNPSWWAEACSTTPRTNVHMGTPPFSAESGCLGP